jgi:hypothetical protein
MIKKDIIAVIGFIGINAISFFLVLPIAQNLENQHYGDGFLILLYMALVVAIPLLINKYFSEHNEKTFRILIAAIIISLIAWAIKFFFLNCSICLMAG